MAIKDRIFACKSLRDLIKDIQLEQYRKGRMITQKEITRIIAREIRKRKGGMSFG